MFVMFCSLTVLPCEGVTFPCGIVCLDICSVSIPQIHLGLSLVVDSYKVEIASI